MLMNDEYLSAALLTLGTETGLRCYPGSDDEPGSGMGFDGDQVL
jgi:hypothetical protein